MRSAAQPKREAVGERAGHMIPSNEGQALGRVAEKREAAWCDLSARKIWKTRFGDASGPTEEDRGDGIGNSNERSRKVDVDGARHTQGYQEAHAMQGDAMAAVRLAEAATKRGCCYTARPRYARKDDAQQHQQDEDDVVAVAGRRVVTETAAGAVAAVLDPSRRRFLGPKTSGEGDDGDQVFRLRSRAWGRQQLLSSPSGRQLRVAPPVSGWTSCHRARCRGKGEYAATRGEGVSRTRTRTRGEESGKGFKTSERKEA